MRHTVLIVVAALLLGALAIGFALGRSDTSPPPYVRFPGGAAARAAEVARRADAAGVPHVNAARLARLLGADGGAACSYADAARARHGRAVGSAIFPNADADAMTLIIVAVYCPWLR